MATIKTIANIIKKVCSVINTKIDNVHIVQLYNNDDLRKICITLRHEMKVYYIQHYYDSNIVENSESNTEVYIQNYDDIYKLVEYFDI